MMSDTIVFNVNLSRARSATKTIGRCIYCDDPEGQLSREHVIPRGLGGGIVLRNASCEKCRKLTQEFETRCLRGMLLPYRLGHGLVQNLDEMPPFAPLIGRDSEQLDIPFSATPRHLLLPELTQRAARLDGHEFRATLPHKLQLFISRLDVTRTLQSTRSEFGLNINFDIVSHLRMIAKIAHGVAVFDLGLDAFTPTALAFIRGEECHSVPYIFGAQEWEPPPLDPTKLYNQIGWRVTQTSSADYVVSQIKLFATHDTPAISVVVGSTTLSDEEIIRRARPATARSC